MTRLTGIRAVVVSLAVMAMVYAVSACTGSADPGTLAATAGKGGGLSAAVTRSPSAAVALVRASTPESATDDLARTLFTLAPVVVVAKPEDVIKHEAVASAAARAAHAPLLLASSVTAGLAATIRGLHPRAVLTIGLPAGALSARLPGIQVTARASQLPATRAAPKLAGVTVLTDDKIGKGDGAMLAITATAAAAGAPVVGVSGPDPRADPAAIASLARLRPQHVIAIGGEFGSSVLLGSRLAVAETGRQLPGGAQVMFPGHRLVALYGHPGVPGLGALGQQDLSASVARARQLADEYRPLSSVPVVPAFEIIATVAEGSPGPDGSYSYETPVSQLRPWVRKAADDGMYVVLDLQPGRASLLDQARLYQSLLELPNVGLALDPEWKLQPGQVPLQQIGHVDISEVNSVIRWLAGLTARHHLPQKVLVLHQFRSSMIIGEGQLDTGNDDLAIVMHMDGQGTPADKQQTWRMVTSVAPHGVFFGWKNFFVKDTPMVGPQVTMDRSPAPVMISYQ